MTLRSPCMPSLLCRPPAPPRGNRRPRPTHLTSQEQEALTQKPLPWTPRALRSLVCKPGEMVQQRFLLAALAVALLAATGEEPPTSGAGSLLGCPVGRLAGRHALPAFSALREADRAAPPSAAAADAGCVLDTMKGYPELGPFVKALEVGGSGWGGRPHVAGSERAGRQRPSGLLVDLPCLLPTPPLAGHQAGGAGQLLLQRGHHLCAHRRGLPEAEPHHGAERLGHPGRRQRPHRGGCCA